MSVSRPADGNGGQTLRFANGKSSIRKRRTDAAKGDVGPDGEPGAKTVTAWARRECFYFSAPRNVSQTWWCSDTSGAAGPGPEPAGPAPDSLCGVIYDPGGGLMFSCPPAEE